MNCRTASKAQAGNQYADDELLETKGIEVRRDKAGGLMHNKFCVIDGIIVYTGSYNHTANATENNDENYIIIKDIRNSPHFRNTIPEAMGEA